MATVSFLYVTLLIDILMKTLRTIISILLLSCLFGCQQLTDDSIKSDRLKEPALTVDSQLSEVTMPKTIRELSQSAKQYNPRIEIITPRKGTTSNRTDIKVELEVTDFPVFQDERSNLGNHLSLLIDNEPLPPIYDLKQPILIKNLMPGTHTLRVFATTPWGESVKTKAAYAQTTFKVLTETNSNDPDENLPLLTYNSPTGTYGAEPILLDFYLANANVLDRSDNKIEQPSVRATVNGTSFTIEKWQPYYLTGFEPGENWVQLELIDESGNNIENTFNNTVRVFNYNPQQQDTLAELVTDKISPKEVQSIVEPNYIQPETPEIIDLQDNTEPEIVIDLPDDKPVIVTEPTENNSTTQSDRNLEADTPSSSKLETEADNSAPNVTIPNLVSAPESELELPKSQVRETSPPQPSTETKLIQIEPTPKKIVIKEPELEEPVVEIVITEPESLEVTELEVARSSDRTIDPDRDAIAIVKSEPEIDRAVPKTKTRLWWKKFLIGLRQQIESLARQLPDEV